MHLELVEDRNVQGVCGPNTPFSFRLGQAPGYRASTGQWRWGLRLWQFPSVGRLIIDIKAGRYENLTTTTGIIQDVPAHWASSLMVMVRQ